jgi:protein-disulfide isomerase
MILAAADGVWTMTIGRFGRQVLIAACLMVLAACGKAGGGSATASADDMTLGAAGAKVTVVEYASASCPHCARFNNDVFPAFKAKYIDTGKVHYVFREFLTEPQSFAAAGFLTARCAGPGKYFEVLDAIYHQQTDLYRSGDFSGGLRKIGLAHGMSDQQFTDCVGSDQNLNAVNARYLQAEKDGIEATPTFVINGQKLEGEQTLDSLGAVIDPLLK